MGLLFLRTNVANKTCVHDDATFGYFALAREENGVSAGYTISNALVQTTKFIQKRAHPSSCILYEKFPGIKLGVATNLTSVGVQDVVHAVNCRIQYVVLNGPMNLL